MNKQILVLITSLATLVISVVWLWSTSNYSKDGYEPILAFLGGLSGVLGVFYWANFKIGCENDTKEYDVFLSSPMTSIDEKEYNIMYGAIEILEGSIKKHTSYKKIYSVSLKYKRKVDIDDEITSANNDLLCLRKSKNFILIYPEKLVTSCLVEVGYAIGLGIPCVFFVHNKSDLPYMLREIGQIKTNILIYTYTDTNNLESIISRKGSDLFPAINCRN